MADLQKQVGILARELKEAREQQAATADVLKVISRSTFDLHAVLQTLVESAPRLCDADMAQITRQRDGVFFRAEAYGYPDQYLEYARTIPIAADRGSVIGRALLEGTAIHVPDVLADPEYTFAEGQRLAHFRAALAVPMLRQGGPIGVIVISRKEARPFTQKQIELATTFADQAVIAIENTRLFNETKEALARQTATSDVLKVIASSPSNLQPVFDAIAERSNALVGGHSTTVFRFVGEMAELAASTSVSEEADAMLRAAFPRPISTTLNFEPVVRGGTAETVDTEADAEPDISRNVARARGFHSRLMIPLKSDSGIIGTISITRKEPGAFAAKDKELLQTFADQAVIAIQNVELFEEVQARTRDLQESLQFQTATSEVLQIISFSPGDLTPVFDKMLENATRVCGAEFGSMLLVEGDMVRTTATFNAPRAFVEARIGVVMKIHPKSAMAAAIRTRHVVQVEDYLKSPAYLERNPISVQFAELSGARTMVVVPMLREDDVIGLIIVYRQEVRLFGDKQIDLLTNFARQAVIAIENARLLRELRQRTDDLSESLQQQTATSEVLQVISSSPGELGPVFDKMLENATRVCGAEFGSMVLVEGDTFRNAAIFNAPAAFVEARTGVVTQLHPQTSLAAAIRTRQVVQVEDLRDTPAYLERVPSSVQLAELGGARTIVVVPMLRDDEVIGLITVYRQEVRLFGDKQIELLTNFARQAVIAIENARLLRELRQRTDDLTEALVYQTGSSNILKVIASSPTDVEPALKAIVDSACEICNAYDCSVVLKDGDDLVVSAHHGPIPPGFTRNPISRKWVTGRAVVDKVTQHVHDLLGSDGDDFRQGRDLARLHGYHTVLSVPLLREGDAIGAIVLRRKEIQPFNDKQIELLKSFADQAVIAISNVRLFEQVQERTRELSKSLEDLRTAQDRLIQTEKLASLGQLTAGIAHEIKNPLNFVNNFSALSVELTDELKDVLNQANLAEKIRQEVGELTQMLTSNLEKVMQHGKRADSIVKNMLLHSREGSGEHRPIEINAIIDESLNLAYHGARAEGRDFNISLERDFDPVAGVADIYPQEVTRVLLNLISNGFYAATKRAGTISDGFEPKLKAVTRNLGDKVEIRIRDNGMGIPSDIREKIFNPFFTTKPAGEGTGLGLSMSHDIVVKQHGGTIEVQTEPGSFTEFIITLPRVLP